MSFYSLLGFNLDKVELKVCFENINSNTYCFDIIMQDSAGDALLQRWCPVTLAATCSMLGH